jgi:hypothetical protein
MVGELTSYLECCVYALFRCYWTFMWRSLMSDHMCSVTVFFWGGGVIRILLQLRQDVGCFLIFFSLNLYGNFEITKAIFNIKANPNLNVLSLCFLCGIRTPYVMLPAEVKVRPTIWKYVLELRFNYVLRFTLLTLISHIAQLCFLAFEFTVSFSLTSSFNPARSRSVCESG